MFFRVTPKTYKGKTYSYLQLIESYRDGDRTRQRVLQSFGNIAHMSDKQRRGLVASLQRALDLDVSEPADLTALDTRHFADLLALRTLWEKLQLPRTIRRLSCDNNAEYDLDLCCFLMVAHRLIDAGSKSALIDWLPEIYLQGHDTDAVQLQHLYRALDDIDEIAMPLEEALFLRVSNLLDRQLSVVFYDLTSTYFEGDGPPDAAYGYSRDRRGDQKQIIVALAVDGSGLPITHLTFPGNTVDSRTLQDAMGHLQERFEIQRTIFVADGGVMTNPNIEALMGSEYEHLIALPTTRAMARELAEGIEWTADDAIARNLMARAVTHPDTPGLTYAVCYNPERAEQERQIRQGRLDRATEKLEALKKRVREGRLKDRDKILQSAASALAKSRVKKYFKVHSERDGHFDFHLRDDRVAKASSLEGYYFLQTDADDLQVPDMLQAYKTLQHVERAFREMKDFIKLRPVYHYTRRRVRSHVFICVLAYLLERMLELQLEKAGNKQSARTALGKLTPIRLVRNEFDDRVINCVVQNQPDGSAGILKALGLHPLPTVIDA